MDTACKDTPIRIRAKFRRDRTFRRIVPEKTSPPQEVSDGIREILRRPPSPRKKENRKKTECAESLPLASVSAVKWVDSVSFENDEIFNVKSGVAAQSRHEFRHVHTCVARV